MSGKTEHGQRDQYTMAMAVTNSNQRLGRLRQQTRILAILFVLSFALDFKGAVGGSSLQFVMAGFNTLTFILIATKYRFRLPVRGGAAVICWGWLLFLVIGSIGALVSGVPVGRYIRVIYPFVLFLEGFLVAWWVAGRSSEELILVDAMNWAAIISFVLTFFWGFYFSGRSVEVIRYQILSPLIPFIIAVAGYDFIFARRHRVRAVLILAVIFGVIAISVTRGMFLVMVMIAISLFAAWFWNLLRGYGSMPRPLLRGLGWGLIVGMLGLGLIMLFSPEVYVRWLHRSLGPARDVTFWTRIAAVVGQGNQLFSAPTALFVGRGFGHSYIYAQLFASVVYPYMSPEVFTAPMWYPGEFMWITPLFYGGMIAGMVGIGVLVYGIIKTFGTLAYLLRKRAWLAVGCRPIWIGILGYYAIMGLSFTSNPMGSRIASMVMGLCLGLAFSTKFYMESQQHR